jgi:hypothetical protein
LSAKSIEDIHLSQFRDNFTFLVGNERIPYDAIFADFLLGRIRCLHPSDASLSEFVGPSVDDSCSFRQFLSIPYGHCIDLSGQNLSSFSHLAKNGRTGSSGCRSIRSSREISGFSTSWIGSVFNQATAWTVRANLALSPTTLMVFFFCPLVLLALISLPLFSGILHSKSVTRTPFIP